MPSHLRSPSRPFIQDSEPLHLPSNSDSSDGGMPGAWPEWSAPEGEEQESEGEECRAMEKVVQILGQLVAGWTKAESLLGSGKVPLSENTLVVWARQDRAKKAAKAADEKLLSGFYGIPNHRETAGALVGKTREVSFSCLPILPGAAAL